MVLRTSHGRTQCTPATLYARRGKHEFTVVRTIHSSPFISYFLTVQALYIHWMTTQLSFFHILRINIYAYKSSTDSILLFCRMLCKLVIYHNLCCSDAHLGSHSTKQSILNEFCSILSVFSIFSFPKL